MARLPHLVCYRNPVSCCRGGAEDDLDAHRTVSITLLGLADYSLPSIPPAASLYPWRSAYRLLVSMQQTYTDLYVPKV